MPLPPDILSTAPKGMEWVIELAGRALYRFRLTKLANIVPNPSISSELKIPDATPEIIVAYAFSDEQALLAKVRYNRLVENFPRANHVFTSKSPENDGEGDGRFANRDRRNLRRRTSMGNSLPSLSKQKVATTG